MKEKYVLNVFKLYASQKNIQLRQFFKMNQV